MDLDGRIIVGMTRDDVVRALGPPDDVGVTTHGFRTPAICKYIEIELHFEPRKDGRPIRAYTEDEQRNGIVLLESASPRGRSRGSPYFR